MLLLHWSCFLRQTEDIDIKSSTHMMRFKLNHSAYMHIQLRSIFFAYLIYSSENDNEIHLPSVTLSGIDRGFQNMLQRKNQYLHRHYPIDIYIIYAIHSLLAQNKLNYFIHSLNGIFSTLTEMPL